MEASTTTRWTRLAPDDRRAAILAASMRVFGSRPYDRIGMSAVAAEAGVSRALVNHYFGSKRELFVATLRAAAEEAPASVQIEAAGGVELMAANTDRWLDYVEAHPYTALALTGAGPFGLDAEMQAIASEIRDAVVERMVANNFSLRDVPPGTRLALRAFTGLFDVAARDWLIHRTATRAEVHELIVLSLQAILVDVIPQLTER